jgi:hypothetical protein
MTTIEIRRDEADRVVTTIDGQVNSRGKQTDDAARRNAAFLAKSFEMSGQPVEILDRLVCGVCGATSQMGRETCNEAKLTGECRTRGW